jgi:DNA-binding LytR/AlgR family response regulator
MKVIIIEDEPATASRLKNMLDDTDDEVRVAEVLDTVEESIAYMKSHPHPDLIFMDIHLADGNSFEIFDAVDITCPIIFTTAYDQYAIKAFKVNSIDYLLKPLKKEELIHALSKFKSSQKHIPDYSELVNLLSTQPKNYLKRFMVKTGQTIKAVDIGDVAYFVVENKIVSAVLDSGQRMMVDFTMDHLEKNLDPERFFRISRSFIVSFGSIDNMIAYSKSRIKITLQPPADKEAITSSERTTSFKNWLSGQ